NRKPVTKPAVIDRNLTPSSTAGGSGKLATDGVDVTSQMLHGHVCVLMTLTVALGPGVSTLPLSSVARLLITTEPAVAGLQWYVQLSRPVAECHDAPLSTDTSTAATIPPVSTAVPLIVMLAPTTTVDPLVGEPIVEVGRTTSTDAALTMIPGCGRPG